MNHASGNDVYNDRILLTPYEDEYSQLTSYEYSELSTPYFSDLVPNCVLIVKPCFSMFKKMGMVNFKKAP